MHTRQHQLGRPRLRQIGQLCPPMTPSKGREGTAVTALQSVRGGQVKHQKQSERVSWPY
jgi:hypothetical protein